MVMKFTNNAATTLASGITNVATSLTVSSGTGSLFPSLGAGDYFFCTLANTSGLVEIVKVTARSTDTFTITRGQDGTSGSAWLSGDKVELRLVAASLNDIPKLDEANTFTGANAYGTPTSLTLTNATGLPISTGVSGLGTGIATALAVNVGTAGAPVVNGGALGTPSSGTLTNATGLPVGTGISGLGTGVATALAAAVTGSGSIMLGTNPTVTNYTESVVAIGNSGTTQTLSLTSGTVQTITMTGNCTFTMPTATAGKSFILIAVQDGTGSRTATFTSVKWPNGVAPTMTTTATTGRDIFTFVADGTNWYGSVAQAFA